MSNQYFLAFTLGLKEGINPYALVTLLLFCALLSFFGRTSRNVYLFGSIFLISLFTTNFILNIGALDRYLSKLFVYRILEFGNLAFGFLLLIFGFRQLYDWFKLIRSPKQSKQNTSIPFFLKHQSDDLNLMEVKNGRISKIKFRTLPITALLTGFLLTVFSSVWGQNYYIFLMFSRMIATEEGLIKFLPFVCYSIAYCLPLFLSWLAILIVMRSKKTRMFLSKSISIIRIGTSAIHLSLGIGILWLHFNVQ